MLEEIALVVKSTPEQLWIETQTRSSCSHCSSRSGCGTSVLAKLFSVKHSQVQLDNSLGVKSGEKVVIGMPDELLIRAAVRVYLLPLLAMVLMTILANIAGAGDGIQSLSGLAGLAIGFILLRQHSKGTASHQHFKPRLLRLVDQTEVSLQRLSIHKTEPVIK